MLYIDNQHVSLSEAFYLIHGKGTKAEPVKFSEAEWKKKHIFTVLAQNVHVYEKNSPTPKKRACSGVGVETFTPVSVIKEDGSRTVKRLQWAQNRSPKSGIQGEYNYFPETISIDNEGTLIIENDAEKAFFLAVGARCATSENNHDGVTKKYTRYDKRDRTKERMQKERYKLRLLDLIVGDDRLDDHDLRAWAKTIVHLGQQHAFVDPENDDIFDVQEELHRLANKDYENVKRAFESFNHRYRQTIEAAKAAKFLVYKKADRTWVYTSDQNVDSTIMQLRFDQNGDPTDILIDFFADGKSDKGGYYNKMQSRLNAVNNQ